MLLATSHHPFHLDILNFRLASAGANSPDDLVPRFTGKRHPPLPHFKSSSLPPNPPSTPVTLTSPEIFLSGKLVKLSLSFCIPRCYMKTQPPLSPPFHPSNSPSFLPLLRFAYNAPLRRSYYPAFHPFLFFSLTTPFIIPISGSLRAYIPLSFFSENFSLSNSSYFSIIQ